MKINYLAINEGDIKGVYQYLTKEERHSILKSLGLSKTKGKVFSDKNEALLYAEVSDISNEQSQVIGEEQVIYEDNIDELAPTTDTTVTLSFKVNYLAINEGDIKGVYQYLTKEERHSILKSLGLGKTKGKVFSDKDEALLYADVTTISSKPNQVINEDNTDNYTFVPDTNVEDSSEVKDVVNESQPIAVNQSKITPTPVHARSGAMKMLQILTEKGFDFAKITLTDGYSFEVVLRDLDYLSTRNSIHDNANIHKELSGDSHYYFIKEPMIVNMSEIKSFNEYKDDMLKKIENYNKKLNKCVHPVKYTIKDALMHVSKYVDSACIRRNYPKGIIKTLNATKIEHADNFLYFDKVSLLGMETYQEHYYTNTELMAYIHNEDTIVENYVINTDYIFSITPSVSEWKVTDQDFLDAFKNNI